MFLHGLGQDSFSWQEVLREFGKDEDADCPDLFFLCKEDLSYQNLYSAFEKYCDRYKDTFSICGLSLGGILALDYTLKHSDRIKSLVLIGSQYRIPKKIMRFQNFVFRLLPNKTFQKMGLSKKEVLSLTESMINLDFEKKLRKIQCPVLILCGEKDYANKKAAMELKSKISHAEYKEILKTGHEVNKDNPKLLARVLEEFLGV